MTTSITIKIRKISNGWLLDTFDMDGSADEDLTMTFPTVEELLGFLNNWLLVHGALAKKKEKAKL
jgi:hypothetical protein